jgi:hypothetical protein
MIRTRAAAPLALAFAASWVAACTGGVSAYRAGPSATPASTDVAATSPGPPLGAEEREPSLDRPGLGTEFGEQVDSRVVEQPFERSSSDPFALVAVHYNDADGVEAQARSRGGALAPFSFSMAQDGVSIAVVGEDGEALPGLTAPDRLYVVGRAGQRYSIHISNRTDGRFEVVASVDGLDVIDGRQASPAKRGYIVPPRGDLTIDGFRTSDARVAAFRFAAVRDSYASRTGDDRNVGVIGFAFFAEAGAQRIGDEIGVRESADPFPGRYAAPPP